MFDLSLEMMRAVEDAAIASARTMGMGDPNASDQAAVESMRRSLDTVPIEGRIVIGEGERDEAPMLYIGERVGAKNCNGAVSVDIAVDPLEGTNLCSTGGAGAITVLAVSEPGGLLHAWTDVEEYFGVMSALVAAKLAFAPLPPPTERQALHDMDYHTSFERKKRKLGLTIYRARWIRRQPTAS